MQHTTMPRALAGQQVTMRTASPPTTTSTAVLRVRQVGSQAELQLQVVVVLLLALVLLR
jgi:hypothetical protein